jgi:ADP-heptose:LPS heptosyltransferase
MNGNIAEPGRVKKILIVNLGGIGDLLLSIPALKGIRKTYNKAEISFLAVDRVYRLAGDLEFIDKVYLFDKVFLPRDLATIINLRKERFDLGVNMRTIVSVASGIKMRILFQVIAPKVSAGRNTDGRGNFFDIKIPETRVGNKPEMEYDIEMAEKLGCEVTDRSIHIKIKSAAQSRVRELLKEKGISGDGRMIGIHIGGMPSRRWPLGNFAKVIDAVYEKTGCAIAVTGGPGEEYLFQDLKDMCSAPIVDMVNTLDVWELFALIDKCALFISNDTGPMHIAAVLNVPLVAIFGPGYLTRFDPRVISDKAAVLYKETQCAPCDRIDCGDKRCLRAVKPETVIRTSFDMIKKNNRKDQDYGECQSLDNNAGI